MMVAGATASQLLIVTRFLVVVESLFFSHPPMFIKHQSEMLIEERIDQ
jgi:hypothetical protein